MTTTTTKDCRFTTRTGAQILFLVQNGCRFRSAGVMAGRVRLRPTTTWTAMPATSSPGFSGRTESRADAKCLIEKCKRPSYSHGHGAVGPDVKWRKTA